MVILMVIPYRDPITERQMMSTGCIITTSERYLGSIAILRFGDWIPRDLPWQAESI